MSENEPIRSTLQRERFHIDFVNRPEGQSFAEKQPRLLDESSMLIFLLLQDLLPFIETRDKFEDYILGQNQRPEIAGALRLLLGVQADFDIFLEGLLFGVEQSVTENGFKLKNALTFLYTKDKLLSRIEAIYAASNANGDSAQRKLSIMGAEGVGFDTRELLIQRGEGISDFEAGNTFPVRKSERYLAQHVTSITRPDGVFVVSKFRQAQTIYPDGGRQTVDIGKVVDVRFKIDPRSIYRLGPASERDFFKPDRDGMQAAARLTRRIWETLPHWEENNDATDNFSDSSVTSLPTDPESLSPIGRIFRSNYPTSNPDIATPGDDYDSVTPDVLQRLFPGVDVGE